MRAMIANLGCEMAQIGLASLADIDTAMKLGLNYPLGPLEIAEEMGLARTHPLIGPIHEAPQDPPYRPSLWLRLRALLGLPMPTAGSASRPRLVAVGAVPHVRPCTPAL